jgi:hypothetical protein
MSRGQGNDPFLNVAGSYFTCQPVSPNSNDPFSFDNATKFNAKPLGPSLDHVIAQQLSPGGKPLYVRVGNQNDAAPSQLSYSAAQMPYPGVGTAAAAFATLTGLFPGATPDVPLTLGNVNRNFRRFLWQARIPHGGRGHGPRVHDLRHAMAVNNLRSWFAHGENVDALLPVLQTYLGHSSIGDTAYYLRLTAASYPDITARVKRTLGDIVSPVTGGADHGD